ncbi:hypothetical protein Tco_0365078 [Tanacetum coccineum]
MHQQQPNYSPNQFITYSNNIPENNRHHLEVEDTEDEDEPVPTPTSKPSRGVRLKSKAKKNKEKEPPLEKQKRIRNAWTQDGELLLAECFIQVSEIQKQGFGVVVIKSELLCGTKSKNVIHTWGENDDEYVEGDTLYDATVGGWSLSTDCAGALFLKRKTQWTTRFDFAKKKCHFWDRRGKRSILEMMILLDHFPVCNDLLKSQRMGSNSKFRSGVQTGRVSFKRSWRKSS